MKKKLELLKYLKHFDLYIPKTKAKMIENILDHFKGIEKKKNKKKTKVVCINPNQK